MLFRTNAKAFVCDSSKIKKNQEFFFIREHLQHAQCQFSDIIFGEVFSQASHNTLSVEMLTFPLHNLWSWVWFVDLLAQWVLFKLHVAVTAL